MASYLKLEDIESYEYVDCDTVYDITVDGAHNYYLDCGDNILVHNSGKTYSTLQFLIIYAYKNTKPCLISVVAESVPHLKRGAYRDFIKILLENKLYDRQAHNKSDFTYKIGATTIEFFSADNDAKLRGARRNILYVNECNNISYDAYTQLEIRTQDKVLLDYNPVSHFWVHDKVLNNDGVNYIHSTYLDCKDHKTQEFLIDDNIVKAIESRKPVYDNQGNLIKGDENFWRVYGLGEVGVLEGLIFTNVNTVKEFPEECKWIAYGLDFGYTNDPTSLIKVGLQGGELWLDELVYETGLTNPDISNKLKELGLGKTDEIIADSAEPKSIEEIKRMGWRYIKPTHKGKDSIVNGIDILKRYKLNVTQNSVNLIKEFRNYQWAKDKEGVTLNKPIDDFNHAIDAIRYVGLMKIGKPKPKFRGVF